MTGLLAAALVLQAATVAAFFVLINRMTVRHDNRVDRLLQRIQAPEQAVIEHAAQPDPDRVLFVSPFDDAAFNDLKAAE
jgi:hypothetical protein